MARRSGGRQARKALRSAPLTDTAKQVCAGELGGQYRPLDEAGIARGIEVNERTLSLDNLFDVCTGATGHYLGSDQTLEVMQSEYIYPDFSDRNSPTVWEDSGKPVMLDRAIEKRDEILASHFPKHISDETDRRVREQFPIALSPESVGRA